jgi:hypothetical protein
MDDDNRDGSRDRSAEGVRTGAKGDEGGGGGASSSSSSDGGEKETRSFPRNDDDDDDNDDRGRFLRSSRREVSLSRIPGWMFNWRRLGIVRVGGCTREEVGSQVPPWILSIHRAQH